MNEYYNRAWEEFLLTCGENEPEIEKEFAAGWNACKETILKRIGKPEDYCCDYVYDIANKIKEL